MTVADSSGALLTGSLLVYVFAMIAHAIEWASAREPRPQRSSILVEVAASPGSATADDQMPRSARSIDAGAAATVELWGRIGVALLTVGFLLNLTGVITRGIAASRAPARISTMPCRWASASIRETLGRLVPRSRATSAWERRST